MGTPAAPLGEEGPETMNEIDGHCAECAETGAFAQVHPDPGSCRDASEGICPEWYCIVCGAAVLISLLPASWPPARQAELTGRAA